MIWRSPGGTRREGTHARKRKLHVHVHKHVGKKRHKQEPKVAWGKVQIRLRRQGRVTLGSALTVPKESKLCFEINKVVFKDFKEDDGIMKTFFPLI